MEVRVVSATAKWLEQEVVENRFREAHIKKAPDNSGAFFVYFFVYSVKEWQALQLGPLRNTPCRFAP